MQKYNVRQVISPSKWNKTTVLGGISSSSRGDPAPPPRLTCPSEGLWRSIKNIPISPSHVSRPTEKWEINKLSSVSRVSGPWYEIWISDNKHRALSLMFLNKENRIWIISTFRIVHWDKMPFHLQLPLLQLLRRTPSLYPRFGVVPLFKVNSIPWKYFTKKFN